jgi:hypothetical protein
VSAPQPPRRVVVVPVYWAAIVMVTVAVMVVASAVISVGLADRNARDLVARYEADKRATAATNQQFYCALFGAQADAFADATTATGRASLKAWLDLYELARCMPARQR